MKVYLVDDEQPARDYLRQLLGEFQHIDIVGEASRAVVAFQEIMSLSPDILFLDVQMPGLSGVDLTKILGELPDSPLVIFTTAYSQFAVEAFNLEAVDYLLKPFDSGRLSQALERAERHLGRLKQQEPALSDHDGSAPDEQKNTELIVATRQGKMHLFPPRSIVFARCLDSLTFVYVNDTEYRVNLSMTALFEQLKGLNFFRTHRNTVVNLNFVREIHNSFNGCSTLIMDNAASSEIQVSRRKTRALKKHLSIRA